MPQRLALQAVPNQSFSALLDDQSYQITLKETQGVMSATIVLNDEVIISGSRFFADGPLIPYEHLEGDGGNFLLRTEQDALPAFDEFDVTQFLFYLSAAEVADARS